jgi:hypothetical protein
MRSLKHFLLIPALYFTTALSTNAQTWFEMGLKGGPAVTLLTNSNLFDDVAYNHRIAGTYFFGGKIGINFGPHNGIAFHGGMTRLHQKFENLYEVRTFDNRAIQVNLVDIGVLYHRTKESGYFEVGPRISLVKNPTRMDDGGNALNISEQLYSSYYGFDLGFGAFLIGNDHLTLMTGFRFSYGITPLSDNESLYAPENAIYATSKSVHVLTGMLCLELNYSLGYLVKRGCGQRTAFISF